MCYNSDRRKHVLVCYNDIMFEKKEYKEYFRVLEDLFEYKPAFRSKTLTDLEKWYEEHKDGFTELIDLYEELFDVAGAIEECSYDGNDRINANLAKIQELITETIHIDCERYGDKDFGETLGECISELKVLQKSYPELERKNLLCVYNYVIALMVEKAMEDVEDDKPENLTANNIEEVLEKINLPDIFGCCTDGILMKIQNDSGSFSVIIPFGAMYYFYSIQLDLFVEEEMRKPIAFEWGDSSVDVSGTVTKPNIVYIQDQNVIPIKKIYTRLVLEMAK